MTAQVASNPAALHNAYALIVGISRYRDPRIPVLRYTHADAEAFRNVLIDPARSAFAPENVRLLLDDNATLFNIKDAVSGWLYQRAAVESTVIVFFAGHGHHESDRTGTERDGVAKYLLPWDTQPDNLFASALANLEFNRLLTTIKAKRLVMFMDACYSGGLSAREGARDIGLADPYAALSAGEGRVVLAAAKASQRSWEDESLGHGIFTHHLIEALSGKADTDGDGCVSVLEVFRYLERHVPQSARRLAASDQDPLLWGDIAKDIRLTIDSRLASETTKRIAEAQAKLQADIQAKRARLFEIYNRGELPTEMFVEATGLLDRPPPSPDARQSALLDLLNALLAGQIPSETFRKSREVMGGGAIGPHEIPKRPAEPRFCTSCGAANSRQTAFCTRCGKRMIVTSR